MKNLLKKSIWILVLAFFVVTAVLCCIFAHKLHPNLVSMLGGLWSAVATAILGLIAVMQNKKYKEQSDLLDERQNAPEFFVASPMTLREKWFGDHPITVYGSTENGIVTGTESIFWFCTVDKPVLHLTIVSIEIAGHVNAIDMNGKEVNKYEPYSIFGFSFEKLLDVGEGKWDTQIIFEYENIYGLHYRKIYTGAITVDGKTITSKIWGQLERAERI